jgi:endonuclease YncB( thermonuclease family)
MTNAQPLRKCAPCMRAMTCRRDAMLSIALVALVALVAMVAAVGGSYCAAAEQQPIVACGGDAVTRGTADRVIDGRTFVLGDGREVSLAGIEVPDSAAARDALGALIGGDDVVLRRAEIAADRYGRIVAFAYAVRDGEEIFAQGEMLAAGLARVGARAGSKTCAVELLGREKAARTAKLGLWADSAYQVLDAETPADVVAQRGRFAVVAGTVVSVRESGSTIYVNFGRRWSEDFAVTIRKRNERSFAAAGLDIKALAGRRVRVRGYVEQRSGGSPWMEAARPEQIETADRD